MSKQTINVTKETRFKVNMLKLELNLKTMDAVINYLIENYENK